MDQKRVKAVLKWAPSKTVKELQRFLGFANFYRQIICNYSTIEAPLTSILKGAKKQLTWNDAAESAFQRLKQAFTTAPFLKHRKPICH